MKKKNKKITTRKREGTSKAPALTFSSFGFVVGLLILCTQPLNDIFTAYYYSNTLLYDIISERSFEILNMTTGLGIVMLSGAVFLNTCFFRQRSDTFLSDTYTRILVILLGAFIALALYSCFHKYLHNDEIEHIHSAWYVKNGFIPYKEFFQHHHPLLWYTIAPLLSVFGDTLTAVLASRFVMGMAMLGIAYCTYLTATVVTQSKEKGLVSVVLLFSSLIYLEKAIEVRPDIPQVLFAMVSVYCLFRFLRDRKETFLLFSGLAAGVSFLYLQKTLFLLIAYALIFLYGLYKKEIRIRSAAIFASGLLPLLLAFLLFMGSNGALHDYYLTNWELNLHHFGSDTISLKMVRPFFHFLGKYFLLVIVVAPPLILLFISKKTPREVKLISFLAVAELFSIKIFSVNYKHFYLFALPLLCIPVSHYCVDMLDFFKASHANRIALFCLLFIGASPFLVINSLHSNRMQFEKIRYVLDSTKETDLVYDGANAFNLFRPDVHYFWYQLKVGLSTYNRLTGNKYGDFDMCRLIRHKKPKIISRNLVDYDACGLWSLYDETPYKYTYIRRDQAGRSGE